ncbi:MAG TPA: site-specific integrase, partial [Clostridia bacterium]
MASIQQRGPYSYRITVCEGRNGGKKIRKLKTINLDPKLTEKQIEKEVERQAALFEEEVRKGTYLDGNKITFAEFVDKWLKDYAEKELEPKTLFRYKEMLTSRILPTIGHKKLSKLQPNLLVEFYSNLKEAGIRLDMKYVSTPLLREIVDFYGYNVNSLVKISKVSDKTIKNALDGKAVSVQSATSLSKALDMKLDMLFKPKDEEPGTLSSRT